jgi:hypothetical protein
VTNLLENVSFVLNSIEEGWQVDSVYTDFSKAFDRVCHQLLLEEMSVGIEPAQCFYIKSYKGIIIHRKKSVLVSSSRKKPEIVSNTN